ncbi:hypothetical protein [Streptomyces sp. NPDC048845]|uniref:hypothetical protein n=1 Tax=Streptomyces sp. NPDC048845 TaxID=3155390 RepID=UPI0034341FFF
MAPGPVLPQHESDRATQRLQEAVTGFVDSPQRSVEEADALFADLAARFADSLTERRRALRASWHGHDGNGDGNAATEELRNALRDYRDLTERLLRL